MSSKVARRVIDDYLATSEAHHYIRNQDLTSLYDSCQFMYISELTKKLYECGVNPLEYLTVIPITYAQNIVLPETTIIIPSNIIRIEPRAFINSTVHEVVFEEGCEIIGGSVFARCLLERVVLPKSLKKLGQNAFNGIYRNVDVHYRGTATDWKKIIRLDKFPYTVHCIDYDIEPEEEQ